MKFIIKLNKKYLKLIIFIILFLFVQDKSFATTGTGSCNIQNGPAGILQQYFNDVEKVITNINKEAKPKTSERTFLEKIKDISQYKKMKAQGVRMYNSLPTWNQYFGSFHFYAVLPVYSHVPYPVKRDYKLIENNINYLGDYYETLVTNGVSDIKIENPCTGVNNCKLSGTSTEIISSLITNSTNILSLYTSKITSTNAYFSDYKSFTLVGNNFEGEFSNFYNSYTMENCSKTEGDKGFFKTIEDKWKKIEENGIVGKNAIKEWKDAWKLAVGMTKGNNYEVESKLLKEELGRQGIDQNNADIILKNLKDYHDKPLSFTNNPITNSVKNTFTNNFGASKDSWQSFQETVYQKFKQHQDLFGKVTNGGNTKINDMKKINEEIIKSEDLKKRIDELYEIELPFAQNEDKNNKNLLNRVKNLHIAITQATNNLDKTTPTAEKLCNTQAVGQGKCYR